MRLLVYLAPARASVGKKTTPDAVQSVELSPLLARGLSVPVPYPSVPMTMRQPPPASLDLGTGERPRGHAQQQWINQRSEHCWY
jgi:hypothetical protein